MNGAIKFCIQCGAAIPEADSFCNQCGAKQPDEEDYKRSSVSDGPVINAPAEQERMFRVADTDLYLRNIRSLIVENPDYRKSDSALAHQYGDGAKVYKDLFMIEHSGFVVHRDQTIEIQCNGITVGTASPEDAAWLRSLLQTNSLISMHVEIFGGRYKKVNVDYEAGEYEIEKRDGSDYIVMAYVSFQTGV